PDAPSPLLPPSPTRRSSDLLVAYVAGAQPPDCDLNVNLTSNEGAVEKPNKPAHWFVIDAAIAQEHALPLGHDEAWSAHFDPIEAERRSEEHTSELQSPDHLVCRLLLE